MRAGDGQVRAHMCFGMARQLQSAGASLHVALEAGRTYARKVGPHAPAQGPPIQRG